MSDALTFKTLVDMFAAELPDSPGRDFLADATIRRAYTYAHTYNMDIYNLVGRLIDMSKRRYGDFLEHSFVRHTPTDQSMFEDWIVKLMTSTLNNTIPEVTDPRLLIKSNIYDVLMQHEPLRGSAQKIATDTEISCYNSVIRSCQQNDSVVRTWENTTFKQLYSSRTACVVSHLRLDGSVDKAAVIELASKIARGEITPTQLGNMSESELCPTASDHERETITKRSMQKIKKRENKMYLCPRCKKPATSVTEAQMGAADEGNSVLCECECGMRFQARF